MSSTKPPQTKADPAHPPRPPALWLLVAIAGIGPLALNIFQPSIEAIATEFAVSPADVQWALTVYILGLAMGQTIYGPLSDRFGRKPLLMVGIGGFVLANLWLALAPSFTGVLIGRALQALTVCSGMVITRAIVRDCYSAEKSASAYGYITTAMVAVPAAAPALGYGLESLGSWRYSFWFLIGFAACVLLIVWRLVPETNVTPLRRLNFGSYANGSSDLLRHKVFLSYCGVLGFGTGSFFCFLTGAPYATVEVLGGTGKDFSAFFLILCAGYMGGNFVAGRYSTALGLRRMMNLGHIVGLAASAVFLLNLFNPSMMLLFLPGACVAFAGGLYNPAAMAGALSVRPDIAGTASSLVGIISLLIAIGVSSITNLILAPNLYGFILPYIGCSIGAAICTYFAVRAVRQIVPEPAE